MIMSSSLGAIVAMTKAFKIAKTDPTGAMKIMSELADGASVAAAQIQLDLDRGLGRKKMRRSTKSKA
jgi:hypothetical protein